MNIYGKNSAYTQATDLYNSSNQGTLLGTIVYGTSTSLDISGDYAYIGFRSNGSALYLDSVTIVWDDGQSSGGGDTPSHGDHVYDKVKGVGENLYHTLLCTNTVGTCNAPEKTEACKDEDLDRLCDVCGADMSPATLVNAAYALEAGASLPGTYTLEGTITSIDTAYDEKYKNITVIMTVTGADSEKTIKCFRLKASDAAGMDTAIQNLAVSDVITVTGKLKNYSGTIEFDTACTLDAVTKVNTHEHSYAWNGTVGENSKHTEVCNAEGECSAPSRLVNCTFDEGEITTQPSCTAKGVKTYTCTVCGYQKTEDVAMIPHADLNDDGFCDSCGKEIISIKVGDRIVFTYSDEKVSKELTEITTIGVSTDYEETPACTMVFTVEAGSEEGTVAFKSGDVYMAWTSGNSLTTSEGKTANSSWTVEFDGDNAVIKNVSDSTRILQYNTGAPRFACYTGSQKSIQIYKVPASTPAEPAIVDRNMTLGASLAFSIWATLDKTEYPNAVLTATLNNYTTTFAFGEAETDGRFKFTYTDVVPAEVADEITVKILAEEGGDELASQTFTLYEYLLQVKEADSKYEGLINGLLGYCAQAQIANGKTPIEVPGDAAAPENPADNTAIKDAVFTGVPASAAAAAEINLEMSGYFKSATALNKNVTYLRFEYVGSAAYFTIKKGDADEVAVTLKNGKFIETEGLMPTEFGTDITVTAYDAQNGVISSVVYSVNTYCKRMNTNETNAYSLNLYNYGLTAAAFVK